MHPRLRLRLRRSVAQSRDRQTALRHVRAAMQCIVCMDVCMYGWMYGWMCMYVRQSTWHCVRMRPVYAYAFLAGRCFRNQQSNQMSVSRRPLVRRVCVRAFVLLLACFLDCLAGACCRQPASQPPSSPCCYTDDAAVRPLRHALPATERSQRTVSSAEGASAIAVSYRPGGFHRRQCRRATGGTDVVLHACVPEQALVGS